jgi:uncharacterized protein (DUF2147 family)
MPRNNQILASAALAATILTSGTAMAASDPTGIWMNDTGRGAIEIKECGNALCGHVVWVKDTTDTKGCGRQILGEVTKVGKRTWDNGWIYSPERKRRYDVELRPLSKGRLRVKGYAGTKLLSKTMIWTKAPDDLTRCAEEVVAKAPAGEKTEIIDSKVETTGGSVAVSEEKVAPADEPASEENDRVASDDTGDYDDEGEGSDTGSDIAGRLGEFLKKDGDGNCNLDLPWVNVNFKCQK